MATSHPKVQLWNFILQQLSDNLPTILLYVLESKGSSPGRQGFAMSVADNGEIYGSIGGGIMEHKFVEMAKDLLKKDIDFSTLKPQSHKNAGKNQSGMICSGNQMVYILKITSNHLPVIREIINAYNHDNNYTLNITENGISIIPQIIHNNYHFQFNNENDFFYNEKIGYHNIIHVIGGGHCSLAFCRLMELLHFRVHVYETRKNLNTVEQNVYAHSITIIDNYSELSNLIPGSNDTYVVIMTFGYRTDDEALRALINNQYKYIGVLGSRNKLAKLWEDYIANGISPELLKNIHAPIGFPIKSQTPYEIAVSIAAQIISVKNN